jgi:protein-S-isoprenylcysteine O-methyltransferase Ste14
MAIVLANVLCFTLTWVVWLWTATQPSDPTTRLTIAIAATILLVPTVLFGRWLLDHQPSVDRALWVTTAVHYLVAIFMGIALVEVTRFSLETPPATFPALSWLGLGLMAVSGVALVLVIFHLVTRGAGLPFALALTRFLATNWIYAWTRNPMVLSALAFLIGLGVWLRSAVFLLWMLALLSPIVLFFLTIFEERELEIRFGRSYLDYKARTPMLFPRRPQT